MAATNHDILQHVQFILRLGYFNYYGKTEYIHTFKTHKFLTAN